MKTNFIKFTLVAAMATVVFSNCSKKEEEIQVEPITQTTSTSNLKAASAWSRVFTDDFSNTGSWNNWTRTQRYDYNSSLCYYNSSNPAIATYDGRSCLVLTAYKNGSIWNSGHVKSYYSFKPGTNEEYRTSAYIKLIALNGSSYTGFANTYGMWPAFWTVNETTWPANGEIDIMEGYSYSGSTKFASNLFYGTYTCSTCNQLGTTCESQYYPSEGWHLYDEYWANTNGWVTVTIKLDGVTVKTYSNSINGNLKLENFGPHNIILNLNVGCTTWSAFDNSKINALTKTMMWVDYVTVDKRTI
jgi:hypothetical protein